MAEQNVKKAADKSQAEKPEKDAEKAADKSQAIDVPAHVVMQAPEGVSRINIAGKPFDATVSGHAFIPVEHVETAKSHGFIVTEILKLEAAAVAELKKIADSIKAVL